MPHQIFSLGREPQSKHYALYKDHYRSEDNRQEVTTLVYAYKISHHSRPMVAVFVPIDRGSTE